MILSQKQIEEIAAAVTRDFNEFFFGCETDKARIARATPIDQFATDYLSLDVSFARLSSDGSIYGLTAYENTEYIIEESNAQRSIALRRNQILLDESFIKPGQVRQTKIYARPRVRPPDPFLSGNRRGSRYLP